MVYESLDDLIGAKYTKDGRGPMFDCYGLVLEVAKRYGIVLPPVCYNVALESKTNIIENNKRLFTKQRCKDFCVVELAPRMKFSTHVGFVLNYPYFIHIRIKGEVCIGNLDSLFWNPRIRGFYR